MAYPYYTCDVFTDTRFGGNQLAVLPRAEGLSDRQMQQIAREFNFAETSFVFPPHGGGTRSVRIFTPTRELPFAGHPNVGTAAMLATHGHLGAIDGDIRVVFEEGAGPVPIVIRRRGADRFWCELEAPEPLSIGATVPVAAVAAAISLPESAIVTAAHPPVSASVGLPFLFAELADRDAIARVRPDFAALERLRDFGPPYLHVYARTGDEFDLRTRQLSSTDPFLEDPATGSANAALAGLLAHHARSSAGMLQWRIAQGVELGRPSVLEARAEKRDGRVTGVWIGGETVPVSEGLLQV